MTACRSISLSLSIESVAQLQRVGTAFFEEPPRALLLPFTDGNCLARHESSVVSRLRRRLAEVFEKPVDHRFFEDRYLPARRGRQRRAAADVQAAPDAAHDRRADDRVAGEVQVA